MNFTPTLKHFWTSSSAVFLDLLLFLNKDSILPLIRRSYNWNEISRFKLFNFRSGSKVPLLIALNQESLMSTSLFVYSKSNHFKNHDIKVLAIFKWFVFHSLWKHFEIRTLCQGQDYLWVCQFQGKLPYQLYKAWQTSKAKALNFIQRNQNFQKFTSAFDKIFAE